MTIFKLKYGSLQKIMYDSEDKFTYCYLNRNLDKPIVLGPITKCEEAERLTDELERIEEELGRN